MLEGRYRDVVTAAGGRVVARAPWRPNLIVDGAFTLLAALLKGDADLGGIRYWAVGAGEDSWDRQRPAAVRRSTGLAAEFARLAVPAGAIRYVDRDGTRSATPTPDLEVRLTFGWPDRAVVLREFGLFGGDASEAPGSGLLLNHVIHRRIDLEPGQRLSRQLRLVLGQHGQRRWVEVEPHWLGEAPVRTIDGVGRHFASALEGMGIATVGALASSAPPADERRVPRVRLLEWRSKARLLLRTAAEIHPPAALHDRTVSQILRRPTAELARDAGVAEAEVVRLREQLATLELAMGHDFLGPQTVRALARTTREEPP